MFKCFECGHLFERGEEKRYTEMHGESYLACPICGGAYEETEQCTRCGSHHLEDEIHRGLCEECVGSLMNKDNMRDYLKDRDIEADFYIEWRYDSRVGFASEKLIDDMRSLWLKEVAIKGEDALAECRKFIVSDEFGMSDFAEWLKESGAFG